MTISEHQQSALMKIRAVSFDLDDTLWECEPIIIRAEGILHRWFEEHHPSVLTNHTPESMATLRSEQVAANKHLSGDVSLMRKAIMRALIGERPNAEEVLEQAFGVFYRARSDIELYEGALEMLDALKSRYALAAITNGNADLDIIGLAHYFQDIRRADLDNPSKPAVDMFEACCKRLGIQADELLHIGDNPHSDVLGGQNAGAFTVWFNQARALWPEDVPRATFEVHSLAELQQLLVGKR